MRGQTVLTVPPSTDWDFVEQVIGVGQLAGTTDALLLEVRGLRFEMP